MIKHVKPHRNHGKHDLTMIEARLTELELRYNELVDTMKRANLVGRVAEIEQKVIETS
jgi:hypothetical protein